MALKNTADDQAGNQKWEEDKETKKTINVADSSLFTGLKDRWEKSNPLHAELLIEMRKRRDAQRNLIENNSKRNHGFQPETEIPSTAEQLISNHPEQTESWYASNSLATMPFHHLVAAEKLKFAFDGMSASLANPQTVGQAEARRQLFWQALAAGGVTAAEAALLDNSIWCVFIDQISSQAIELDWEVKLFDELQGCAEIYQAELLVFKRKIYEAGADLRNTIELKSRDFLKYLKRQVFAALETEDVQRLLLDRLMAPFTLTVSRIKEDQNKNRKVSDHILKNFDTYREYGAKRIESWLGRDEDGDETLVHLADETTGPLENVARHSEDSSGFDESNALIDSHRVYRLELAEYWLDWQEAAWFADLDFDLLETLSEARTQRFYELTKLLRVTTAVKKDGRLPNKLEITYEKFASLMPLSPLRSEQQIKTQIRQLISPLKMSGYLKSMTVNTDWRGVSSSIRLTFRFKD